MIKLVTVEQMQQIEAATDAAGTTYDEMMQLAGRAVATVTINLLGDDQKDKRIAILVGPGNNGGDGLVAASMLQKETEAEVSVYLYKPRSEQDQVYIAARDAGVFIANAEDDQRWRVLKKLVANADIVLDALLGTGARLPIKGDMQKLLKHTTAVLKQRQEQENNEELISLTRLMPAQSYRPKIVAVDCPSGLDCDTGEVDTLTIAADVTVTFAAAKYGQFRYPGAEYIGELYVAGIGTPPDLPELNEITTNIASPIFVQKTLPQRSQNSHKGTYGKALVIGGSTNYTGAVALAGLAAYRIGAGLVTLAVPQPVYLAIAAQCMEPTWILLPHDMGVIHGDAISVLKENLEQFSAVLVGPGIGREDSTHMFMQKLIKQQKHASSVSIGFGVKRDGAPQNDHVVDFSLPDNLVIDADGLSLLAEIDDWWGFLPANTVLTPHPGEMSRLTGIDTQTIQSNRINIAREHAARWGCIVVLKGAYTIVAESGGDVTVIPVATDALATAGTGDVLAGCIVGMLAQGMKAYEAAITSAVIHAYAGLSIGKKLTGRAVVAGDLLSELPHVLSELKQ